MMLNIDAMEPATIHKEDREESRPELWPWADILKKCGNLDIRRSEEQTGNAYREN